MIQIRAHAGQAPGRDARRGQPRRVAAGDRADRADWAAAEVLQELYEDAVFDFVVQHGARREEAERITMEVFATAAAGLPRFRGECAPYLWLLEIARRKIAEVRGRRRSSPHETP